MIETSESIIAFATAMAQVQAEVDSVKRDSTNAHFKNRYASLENVVETLRRPCLDAGLTVVQSPGSIVGGNLSLTTLLVHYSTGEWMKFGMQIPLGKVDPQGAGSAITYACRYALMAIFNLPPVDDDAEGATIRIKADPMQAKQMLDAATIQSATPTRVLPFTMPDKITADMTLVAPSIPLDWGKLLSSLTDFAKAEQWDTLKKLWRSNTPFFEALKAYSELDYDRLREAFTSKKKAA